MKVTFADMRGGSEISNASRWQRLELSRRLSSPERNARTLGRFRPAVKGQALRLPLNEVGSGMAVEKDLVNSRSDENFRKGACHAGQWFLHTSQMLAGEGLTAAEIADHLAELADVLSDWRRQTSAMPDGNPWDWSLKDLASVIQERKEP